MQRNFLHVGLFGSVLTITLVVPLIATANQNFFVEQGTDRPGMDYASVAVGNVEDCLAACSADGRCAAFTYVSAGAQPPGFDNPNPICWLKDSVPAATRGPGMISGVKQ